MMQLLFNYSKGCPNVWTFWLANLIGLILESHYHGDSLPQAMWLETSRVVCWYQRAIRSLWSVLIKLEEGNNILAFISAISIMKYRHINVVHDFLYIATWPHHAKYDYKCIKHGLHWNIETKPTIYGSWTTFDYTSWAIYLSKLIYSDLKLSNLILIYNYVSTWSISYFISKRHWYFNYS